MKKIAKISIFIGRDTNHKGNLKFRESVRIPVLRRAVLTLFFILLMTRPTNAVSVGDAVYNAGVRLPENLAGLLIENYDTGKETLTFIVFQLSITEFQKWARDCGISWYMEVLNEPTEVTDLVKNEKKSRYYQKEICVKHGYLFIWDIEDYLRTIIYDRENSTVYVEAFRMKY